MLANAYLTNVEFNRNSLCWDAGPRLSPCGTHSPHGGDASMSASRGTPTVAGRGARGHVARN